VIKAVVFDFDGVIADTEPLHLRALQQICSALGVTLSREEYYADYLGFDDEGAFRRLAETYGWGGDDRQIAALVAEKASIFDEMIEEADDVLYRGAVACVERLARDFPLGVASGALKHEIVAILGRHRLERFFRFVVAAGDTDNGKPAPDPYLRAAELHGMPASACVAIEDSRWGIDSAKGAGCSCIAITHSYPAGELGAADRIVTSLDEISPDLIRQL
jgi:beta-phosphoglucomutase